MTTQNPYKRDGDMTKKLAITMSIIAFCLLICYLFVQYDHFVKRDQCLDRGGAWDYQKNMCRF